MKNCRIAIALTVSLTFAVPAQSRANPAVLAAPAICATGVGCILLGTVIIGGIAYYAWQNSQTQEKYYVPIEDPEEEMERLGNNATQGRIVRARSASVAHSRCEQYADGRKTDPPEYLGDDRWRCRYS